MPQVTTRDLKNSIALCTADDAVLDGVMRLTRKDVVNTWAKIDAKQPSMFGKSGYTIMEDRSKQTHIITIRARYDIDITSAAWIYEARAQSGDRWYKVLGIKDDGSDSGWTVLSCRLVEKGGEVVAPVETEATENPGIRPVDQGVVM